MARIFSSDNKPSDRAVRTLGILAIVALLMIVPVGVTGNEDLQVIESYAGSSSDAQLGWNITEIGDVNNDNKEDYAIGAPGLDRVYIFQGPMPKPFLLTSANWIINGPASSNFGWSVSGLGDYDGDSRDDLIIGAPGISRAYVYRGGAFSNVEIELNGTSGDLFGHSVAGIDYSNTSHYFAIVGAPQNEHFLGSVGHNVTSGAVFLFNLSFAHTNNQKYVDYTRANITFLGEHNNGWFGFTVVNLGYINENIGGSPDLGIGDPYYNNTGEKDNGAFYIQYGKNIMEEVPQITASSMDGSIKGRNQSRFGWFAKGVQDVSPTTNHDFIVGAPFESNVGYAHLFYGKLSAFDMQLDVLTTADAEFQGTTNGSRFGWSADRTMISGTSPYVITIGAPCYDNGTKMDTGALFTYYDWAGTETDQTAESKYLGENAGDNLGYSVCEVQYRSIGDDWLRIMASSPFHGNRNTGLIEILQRNRLPLIRELSCTPPSGNMNTDFTITMNYTDPDGDPPEYVEVIFYQDNLATLPVLTIRLDWSHGTGFTKGMFYTKTTKLPNSVLNSNEPNKPLYMRGFARAMRGSRDIVSNERGMATGPIVDGVAPSAPDIYVVTGEQGYNLDEGTFKLDFEWPEEDAGFMNVNGKVKKLYIALREGKGNSISEANWNDTNPYNPDKPRESFNLSTGKTVYYKTYQFGNIQPGYYADRDNIIGAKDDIVNNPNYIDLKIMETYSIALRAEDESGNWGPLSTIFDVESYWRRPSLPGITTVFIADVPDDMGGALNLSWNPPNMIHPDDIENFLFYVDREPLGNISDFNKLPDFNISRTDDPDTFYDNYFHVDHYFDENNERQTIENGKEYYAAGLAVNWLGQHGGKLLWTYPGVTVIGDDVPTIKSIEKVSGVSLGANEIELTWEATPDSKFVEYQIYGSTFAFTKIDDAKYITTIEKRTTNSLIIDEFDGEDISQEHLYFFTVLVKDHNNHINLTVNPFNITGNSAGPIKTVDKERAPNDYPQQVIGVSILDRDNDKGGVLQLSWFGLVQNIIETTTEGTTGFWQYNVYFSDSPITDIAGMETYTEVRDFRIRSVEIDNLDGQPLTDGLTYYVAVTMVDWDLIENPNLDTNNVDESYSINQSDYISPSFQVPDFQQDVNTLINKFNITVNWSPVGEEDIQDFQYYWIRWTGPRSGSKKIYNRSITSFTVEALTRGSEYWFNISVVDLNDNVGKPTTSTPFWTGGLNEPPVIENIQININDETFALAKGEEHSVSEEDVYIVFFTGNATDDYTSFNKLQWDWNITTPGGQFVERNYRSWDLEITEPGEYSITLVVKDDEGGTSDPSNIRFNVKEEEVAGSILGYILIPVLFLVFIVAIVVVIFVMMSGKKSQKNQMIEQYEERRKDIETMEPIYTNLPTWTCDCGTTQVKLSENAYCNACYQSHEAVPIDGLDDYLTEHDLVLTEMKIDVPPGWQGQDMAKENAEKDLEDRKERAMKALNEEFALWLKGTQWESEIPEVLDTPEGQASQPAPLHHVGAIIPGQAPPSSTLQPTPMRPMPAQPMPMGQPPPGQPMPIQPIRPPMPGQPQQKPPQPPQQ